MSNILTNGAIFSTFKHKEPLTIRGRSTLKDGCCQLPLGQRTLLKQNLVPCRLETKTCASRSLVENLLFSLVALVLYCLENLHHIIWSNQAGSFTGNTVLNGEMAESNGSLWECSPGWFPEDFLHEAGRQTHRDYLPSLSCSLSEDFQDYVVGTKDNTAHEEARKIQGTRRGKKAHITKC